MNEPDNPKLKSFVVAFSSTEPIPSLLVEMLVKLQASVDATAVLVREMYSDSLGKDHNYFTQVYDSMVHERMLEISFAIQEQYPPDLPPEDLS